MRCTAKGLAALAVVATMVLGGCGGDDGDDGLSKSELDSRSATICREGTKQLTELTMPNLADANLAAAWLTDVVGVFDRTVSRLEALEPAEELKADYDAYIAIVEENGTVVKGILAKAKAKDPSGQQDLAQYINDSARDAKTKAAARKAGLNGCARS